MRKVLLTLGFMLFILPLRAEDPPSSEPRPPLPPPPTINSLSEVRRSLVERLTTPEEVAAYFEGKVTRFDREEIVIVKQTMLSLAASHEDRSIIYLLSVYTSNGECYGFCFKKEPTPQTPPKEESDGEPKLRLLIRPPSTLTATLQGGSFF